jgi:hypothetical protein
MVSTAPDDGGDHVLQTIEIFDECLLQRVTPPVEPLF